MLINMIDLDGNTRQYYNVKNVYDWTVSANNNEKYNIYLIYDESGALEGFSWKDEEPNSLTVILSIVKSKNYQKFIPATIEEYRKKNTEVRTLKVAVNKKNAYSLYIPTSWAKEFFRDSLYVDLYYTGDKIVITKSEKKNRDNI